jgi:Bifunctional DNA primase/polymerase, N-terminal
MTAANSLQDWALYLAAMGWHLFPLKPGTKHPTGHTDAKCPRTGPCAEAHQTPEMRATTDVAVLRDAWEHAAWNIGLATGRSRLVVVDLDMPKPGDSNPDGMTALAELAARRGVTVPATYTVTTPRGGKHLYFTAPPGVHLRNTRSVIAPNIDTRAEGGYVVAPGSVLADGGGYELADDTDPAELPAWLVQASLDRPTPAPARPAFSGSLARPDAYAASAMRGECDRVRRAPPGHHNGVLSSAAYRLGRLVGAGMLAQDTAGAELLAAADALITGECSCTPGENARVIDAGLAAGARNPRRVTTRKEAA